MAVDAGQTALHGWPVIRLAAGETALCLAPTIGGRIISLTHRQGGISAKLNESEYLPRFQQKSRSGKGDMAAVSGATNCLDKRQ